MGDDALQSEYLVISRGQWDKEKSPEEIQKLLPHQEAGRVIRLMAWLSVLGTESHRRLE